MCNMCLLHLNLYESQNETQTFSFENNIGPENCFIKCKYIGCSVSSLSINTSQSSEIDQIYQSRNKIKNNETVYSMFIDNFGLCVG